jgi:hypothetical protein
MNEKAHASMRRRLNDSMNSSIGPVEELRMNQTMLRVDGVAMGRLMAIDGWKETM